jgi:hypothetical protein
MRNANEYRMLRYRLDVIANWPNDARRAVWYHAIASRLAQLAVEESTVLPCAR